MLSGKVGQPDQKLLCWMRSQIIFNLLIPSGMFFKIAGGWLDLTLICCRVLLGFMYGLYSRVDKSMVTSK